MLKLTEENLQSLNVSKSDIKSVLAAESALEWINAHTIYNLENTSFDDLTASVKLFIRSYVDLLNTNYGVASQSIEGLSQSFVTGQSLETQIYNLAVGILGNKAITSTVTVFSGEDGWDYGG